MGPVETSIKRKIQSNGVPLKDWNIQINYGIKTGFNDAFIISKEKKDELIASDPKSAEIIRPILRGRDIKRYGYNFADLWLINTHNGIKDKNIQPIDITQYPAIKQHLDKYYSEIAKRTDKGCTPYNLRNCVYMDDFSKQKLVWTPVNSEYRFAILPENVYLNNSLFMIVGENIKTICGLLNSKLYIFYLDLLLAGGCYTYGSRDFFVSIPLCRERSEAICQLDTLVEKISNVADDNVEHKNLLKEIDDVVYSIYKITDEEKEYIDSIYS